MTLKLPLEQQFIDKLTEIIESNFSDGSFGVAELAKEMGISHSTLHRKLKAIAQQSISQFIRETRLKHAMELLQLQAGTVAEIAHGVGFGSATYFTKCFHDYYGYPPGEVRLRYTSDPDKATEPYPIENPEDQIRSLAVLPFENYTGDDSNAFLVFGMHDALISELGQLERIRVISKTSTMAFKGSQLTIKEIAAKLNVDAIIEASVLGADDIIRAQLKLIKAFPEEQQVWAQTFEVDMSNILKLYSQVIKSVAGEIQVRLSHEQQSRLAEPREVNPDSYKAYLRGMYHLGQITPEGTKKGLEYLHEAVRIDPAEPLAYAGLAIGYLDVAHGPFNPGDAYIKAESAANKAMKLDDTMAETHLAIASVYCYCSWNFREGVKYLKRSLELNPNSSHSRYHSAWALYLFGRNEEAIAEHKLAQKYDPFNPLYTAAIGAMYGHLGYYEDAIREANKSFEIMEDYPFGHWALGETYLAMGKNEEAIQTTERLVEIAPEWIWFLGYIYAMTGHREKAEAVLAQLERLEMNSWFAMGLAVLYGALGRNDEAFKWLEYEPHHLWIPWVAVMPMWKPLYSDPRYARFVKKLNLPGS